MGTIMKPWADVLSIAGYNTVQCLHLEEGRLVYLYAKRVGDVLFVVPREFPGDHPTEIVAFNYIRRRVRAFEKKPIEFIREWSRWRALKQAETNLATNYYLWREDLPSQKTGFLSVPRSVVNFFKGRHKTVMELKEELCDLIIRDEYNTPLFERKHNRLISIIGKDHPMAPTIKLDIKRRQYAVSQEG